LPVRVSAREQKYLADALFDSCRDSVMEQRAAIKFCAKFGKTASETYQDLKNKSMEMNAYAVQLHLCGSGVFRKAEKKSECLKNQK